MDLRHILRDLVALCGTCENVPGGVPRTAYTHDNQPQDAAERAIDPAFKSFETPGR